MRWQYWPGSPLRLRACSLSLCPGLPQESSGPLSPPRCPGAGTGSHLWSRSAGRGDTTAETEWTQWFFLNPFFLFLLLPAFWSVWHKCMRLWGCVVSPQQDVLHHLFFYCKSNQFLSVMLAIQFSNRSGCRSVVWEAKKISLKWRALTAASSLKIQVPISVI